MIVPTARTATLAALAAPAALVVAALAPGAWVLVPAAGVALLALVLLDGFMAGQLADVRLAVPADAEVGEPLELALLAEIAGRRGGGALQAAVQFDPRLAEGGRADFPLLPDAGGEVWRGSAALRPNRRGTAAVERFWLRWPGPLGLACRQVEGGLGAVIRAHQCA